MYSFFNVFYRYCFYFFNLFYRVINSGLKVVIDERIKGLLIGGEVRNDMRIRVIGNYFKRFLVLDN